MPPVVVETVPDTFAVVEPGVREFFFRFNERISERPSNGQMNNAVVISPAIGAMRVRHRRDGISIEAQEGLESGRLYRVTVLPVINDMFGNSLRDPFDLILSTGAEFVPNVVAGMVEDRVTGQPVPDVRVEARFGADEESIRHWNLTGTDGVFSLRYVPETPFELRAWQDRDRDGEVGESEPQSALSRSEFAGSPDTSFTVLSLIEPDTTPARLASVTVDDSVTLTFEFDDYLEPQMPGVLFAGRLILARLLDTTTVAEPGDTVEAAAPEDTVAAAAAAEAETPPEQEEAAGDSTDVASEDSLVVEFADTVTIPPGKDTIAIRFYHQHEYQQRQREVADSIAEAEAQARADSLAQAGLPPGPPEEPPADTVQAPDDPVGLSGLLLPAQTVIGVLDEALVRGAPYEASVTGLVNIAGTPGGGGTTIVLWELPPADTTDTTTIAGDSLEVSDSLQVGDSLQIGPDTTAAGTDTTTAATDTTTAGPDTTTAGPDTTTAGPDTTTTGPDTTRAGPDTTRVAAPPLRRSRSRAMPQPLARPRSRPRIGRPPRPR